MTHAYPYVGVFQKEPDNTFTVSFIDIPQLIASGTNFETAYYSAITVLEQWLWLFLQENGELPIATRIEDIYAINNNCYQLIPAFFAVD